MKTEIAPYTFKAGDNITRKRIEAMNVTCPVCGKKAKLIWSAPRNETYTASWQCSGTYTPNRSKEHPFWATTNPSNMKGDNECPPKN